MNRDTKKCPKINLKEVIPVHMFDELNRGKPNTLSELTTCDIYVLDIQALLSQLLLNQLVKVWPRWCTLIKPQAITSVNVVIVHGVSANSWSNDISKYAASKKFNKHLEAMMKNLNQSIKFVNPHVYGVSLTKELLNIPTEFLSNRVNQLRLFNWDVKLSDELSLSKKNELKRYKLSDVDVIEAYQKRFKIDENITKDKFTEPKPVASHGSKKTDLLLSLSQMIEECIPIAEEDDSKYQGFRLSKPSGYKNVTEESAIFAIDCEMVQCVTDYKALAAVSVVNEQRELVYHSYVKPPELVINYLTKYSGVTYEKLKDVTKTLADVQNDLDSILPPDAILAGQSIRNDLEALKMFHPYIIDTSILFHICGYRRTKTSLKKLAAIFLDRDIQKRSHDPIEDALATMDLVLLKLSKGIAYGDDRAVLVNELSETNGHSSDIDNEMDENSPDVNYPVDRLKEISEEASPTTTNRAYLAHRSRLVEIHRESNCVHMFDDVLKALNNPFSLRTVGTLGDDKKMFVDPWFDPILRKSVETQQHNSEPGSSKVLFNHRRRPINISEITQETSDGIKKDPSKKWWIRFLRKVNKEFVSLDPSSLFCVLFAGSDECSQQEQFGKMFFGLTPAATNTL